MDGCCNNSPGPSGSYEIATNATESSSGLPYIQLLTCVSQAPTFNATLPTGSLLFNEISCPPGWNGNQLSFLPFLSFFSEAPLPLLLTFLFLSFPWFLVSYSSAGRFIVSLPSGGVAGATFGADSLEPGYTGNLIHDHQFEGQVELGSTGVGLASGCCGGGYAQSNIYYYQGTTGSDATNLPYIMIPMCVKLDEEEEEGY